MWKRQSSARTTAEIADRTTASSMVGAKEAFSMDFAWIAATGEVWPDARGHRAGSPLIAAIRSSKIAGGRRGLVALVIIGRW